MCFSLFANMQTQYCGEFDNWGAVMSVSGELLCSFELLKPLDSSALKRHIKKGRNERQNMLNSPVSKGFNCNLRRQILMSCSPLVSTRRVIRLVARKRLASCAHRLDCGWMPCHTIWHEFSAHVIRLRCTTIRREWGNSSQPTRKQLSRFGGRLSGLW